MRIAVVDDEPADREKLAADIVSWTREHGLPLEEEPVLLPAGKAWTASAGWRPPAASVRWTGPAS